MVAPASAKARERRWIVLAEDGRHVTLGHHSDPSADEVQRTEDQMRASGLRGWLAVAEGSFHDTGTPPRLMEVRPLADPKTSFTHAAEAFKRIQKAAF